MKKTLVDDLKGARRADRPAWVGPMLATLAREPFSDPNWIFEVKLDGIRCLAFRGEDNLELYSRNHLRLNERFPELINPLLGQRSQSYILDGEIVALEGEVSRFATLQRRTLAPVPIYYYVFDILYFEGHDLTQLSLRERKSILRRVLSFREPLRFTEHLDAEGETYYRQACRRGWEGIIAKRADSIYAHQRSPNWLKFKCEDQQEFVIVGYTEPEGQREGIGALLVAVHEGQKLVYAGKVGTGFDTQTLKILERKLSAFRRATSPCTADGIPKMNVHWVDPRLVAQVAFTEWTAAGKLRHPRYLGLRIDKKPSEVVRERPRRMKQ